MILGLASAEEEGKEKDEDEAQSWPNTLDGSQGKCTKDCQLLYYVIYIIIHTHIKFIHIYPCSYTLSWKNNYIDVLLLSTARFEIEE